MPRRPCPRTAPERAFGPFVLVVSLVFLLAPTVSAQQATLSVPSEVTVGAVIPVTWTGPGGQSDFISVDEVGAPDNQYGRYEYARESPVDLRAPGEPGSYVVRYHAGGSGSPVLASAPIEVVATTAEINVLSPVGLAEPVEVRWTGPNHPGDFIGIDPEGAPEKDYGRYVYTSKGSPLTIPAPDVPGRYLVRYHLGVQGYAVIGSAPLVVEEATATLEAPDRVEAGADVEVRWDGPANPRDFISIDPQGAPEGEYGRGYQYIEKGNPLTLAAPEEPGTYEIRYHLGTGGYRAIGSKTLEVGGVVATVEPPASIVADEPFEVRWTGPDNEFDFVTIVPLGAPDKDYGRHYGYTRRGDPVRIKAPKVPGQYEVRYMTGRTYKTLARATVEVTPSDARGTLVVVDPRSDASSGSAVDSAGAVEVILDASGSMLQRLDGTRRIELARAALLDLVGDTLAPGTPFALRVFGHREADSCRTDLEIPLSPLDPGRTASAIGDIEAKNLAKTPIADSLRKVASDLSGAEGPRLVVLLTDGEETCGGDPAAAIEELKASGIDVRVNIVGFAIDELMVKEEFERWARLGGGRYLDAQDGEALRSAVRGALQTTYEVLDGDEVVASGSVNGDPVELRPGTYTVRAGGTSVGTVEVVAKTESRLEIEP